MIRFNSGIFKLMYIIVGLGNPGKQYEGTRHNVGRDILLRLAQNSPTGFEVGEWKINGTAQALVADFVYEGKKGKLVLPETYMNLSGRSVGKFVKNFSDVEQLVVIQDELDLPVGKMRLSFDRGAGGHKGILSIITMLRTKAFVRIRVGVKPLTADGVMAEEVTDFVLGKFTPEEQQAIEGLYTKVVEALEMLLTTDYETAAGKFNTK